MTEDDAKWMRVLEAFFPDLLEHLVPGLRGDLFFEGAFCLSRSQLGLERAESRRESRGSSRMGDARGAGFTVVAEVPHVRLESCLVLVQVETEARPPSRIEARLEQSYLHLHLGLRRPVVPIVLHLREHGRGEDGESGFGPVDLRSDGHRSLVRDDGGVTLFRLDYRSFCLGRMRAESHLGRSLLAPALAAQMRSERWRGPELELECMANILGSDLDPGRQGLLLQVVEGSRPPRPRETDRALFSSRGLKSRY